jgi:hypothetical protein
MIGSYLQHRCSQALLRIGRKDVFSALLDVVGGVRHDISIFVHGHVHKSLDLLASGTLNFLLDVIIQMLLRDFVSTTQLHVTRLHGLHLLHHDC